MSSVYAPPCVVPPSSPDNGGATTSGVTRDEITVVVYVGDPALDPLVSAFSRTVGIAPDPAADSKTIAGYLRLFEAHEELYGRHLKIVTYTGTGASTDEVSAKADAIAIADQYHPFAVIDGPTQASDFADELAARGVICVGSCSLAFPELFTACGPPISGRSARRPSRPSS